MTNAEGERPLAAATAVAGRRAPAIVSTSRERKRMQRPSPTPARASRPGALLHQPARRDAPAILLPVTRAQAKLWLQKWRWYERNALPWNRAAIHWEFARREAFVRWPVHGNVLE